MTETVSSSSFTYHFDGGILQSPDLDIDLSEHLKGKFLHGMTFSKPHIIEKCDLIVGGSRIFKVLEPDMDLSNVLEPYMLTDKLDVYARYHKVILQLHVESKKFLNTMTKWRQSDNDVVVLDERGDPMTMKEAEPYDAQVWMYEVAPFSCEVRVSDNLDDPDGMGRYDAPILQKIECLPAESDWLVRPLGTGRLYGLWDSRSKKPVTAIPEDLERAMKGTDPFYVALKNEVLKIGGMIGVAYAYM